MPPAREHSEVAQRSNRTLSAQRLGLDRKTTDSAHHVVNKSRGDNGMALLLTIAGGDPATFICRVLEAHIGASIRKARNSWQLSAL